MTQITLNHFNDEIPIKNGGAIVTYPNRSLHIGQFKNGQPHGFGCIIEENDEIYSGIWRRGFRIGDRIQHQPAHKKTPLGNVRTKINFVCEVFKGKNA